MSIQQRRKYNPGLTRNAVQLTEEPGQTVSGVAENFGISKVNAKTWPDHLITPRFRGRSCRTFTTLN